MGGLQSGIIAGALSGVGGTCVGAILAMCTQVFTRSTKSNKIENLIKPLISFSGGMMIVVVCLDLIPAAYDFSGFSASIAGVILGCVVMPIFDIVIKFIRKPNTLENYQNNYSKVSMAIFFSIALHNFPEGLAVGTGYLASAEYGSTLAIVIALHNIPEGLALALPMIGAKKRPTSIIAYAFICGMPTVIGALMGGYAAGISIEFIGVLLGFAAGAMTYVVLGELFPISYNQKKSKKLLFLR